MFVHELKPSAASIKSSIINPMPYLEIKGASKRFGTHEVLTDINLEVEKGEFVAIIGYSGAGKPTLMSLILGLQFPDEGTVTLDGKKVTGPGPDRAIVFQNYRLLPWLTAMCTKRAAAKFRVARASGPLVAASRRDELPHASAAGKRSAPADLNLPSSFRRDAETSRRDACATQTFP